jgi:hypothetical protein
VIREPEDSVVGYYEAEMMKLEYWVVKIDHLHQQLA